MVSPPFHRPFSSRREQRGATVFVVVLAITLLTAVGLFAAHSATMVDEAAGYVRMARQTQQLAEYGTLAVTAELGSGTAESHITQLYQPGSFCIANADRADASCYKRSYADIKARTKELSDDSLTKDPTGTIEDVVGNPKANPPTKGRIPVSASTWWKGVKTGRYPAPLRISTNRVAWIESEVDAVLLSFPRAHEALATPRRQGRKPKAKAGNTRPCSSHAMVPADLPHEA
jgi:hypothetical protein